MHKTGSETRELRICVVGAGTRFLSGISYYTLRLANALAPTHRISVILMRQLLPTSLFPGRDRVGAQLTSLEYDQHIRRFDGVDWYWLPSMFGALLFLVKERPKIVLFQWWSGTVLHSYALLALWARILGAKVVIEFHEVLDPAEAGMPLVRAYVRAVSPLVIRLAHAFVVHSVYDHRLLEKAYDLGTRRIVEIAHGPYDHYLEPRADASGVSRTPPETCCNLLFFGLIRPYKGLEDLVRAFDMLGEDEINGFWLTVVGETWENWTLPTECIASSRYRDRITLVNRYVSDAEVATYFAGADAVVLPYRRSSSSGALHIAQSYGLPVVVTSVGGLVEAVAGYDGTLQVPPDDLGALCNALRDVAGLRGRRFANPRSWERIVTLYDALFHDLSTTAGNEIQLD